MHPLLEEDLIPVLTDAPDEYAGLEKKQIQHLREAGLLGSKGDPFWTGEGHSCCGSPRSYYHKVGCPACGDGVGGALREERILTELQLPKLRAGAWRRSLEQAKTMYGLYLYGTGDAPMSLADIGRAYQVSRQAVYDIFASRHWPMRSKQYKGLTVIDGVRYTLDGAGYLRGSKDGRRIYAHKVLWEEANGPVPGTHVLHTRDGDKLNLELSNWYLVHKSEMHRVFNPERKLDVGNKKNWETRRRNARAAKQEEDL